MAAVMATHAEPPDAFTVLGLWQHMDDRTRGGPRMTAGLGRRRLGNLQTNWGSCGGRAGITSTSWGTTRGICTPVLHNGGS